MSIRFPYVVVFLAHPFFLFFFRPGDEMYVWRQPPVPIHTTTFARQY